MADLGKIRIDKWLWYARFFKTRTLATSLAGQGRIRVNGDKISKASVTVKTGDVLTFPKDNHIRVIEIRALGTRRGPANEAQSLYLDLQPPTPAEKSKNPASDANFARPRGSGRPTKRERRKLDTLRKS